MSSTVSEKIKALLMKHLYEWKNNMFKNSLNTPNSAQIQQANNNDKFHALSKDVQKHLKTGELGFYRNDLYDMAQILEKEGKFQDALSQYLVICYIDLWGFDSVSSWKMALRDSFRTIKPRADLAPGIINRIRILKKKLTLTNESLRETYNSQISETLTPDHIMSIDECYKIITLYLDKESEKAEKTITSYIRRYKKTHSP